MFKTGAICGTNSLRAFLNAGRSKSTIGDAEKNRASEMRKKKKMKGRPWVKDLGERRLDVRIPVRLWTMIYDQWWDEKDDIEHQTTPIAPICTLMCRLREVEKDERRDNVGLSCTMKTNKEGLRVKVTRSNNKHNLGGSISRNMISTSIFTPWNSLIFYLSRDVNFAYKWKRKNKGQTKTGEYSDATEFHIGNSTFLVPPWVALIYTTHLRRRTLPRPPLIVNGTKYMENMFIMLWMWATLRLKLRSPFKWLLGQFWNLRVFSPTWASYVGQMKMPNSMAFVKESNKEDLSPFHPILQFLLFVVDLTRQLDSDQETSQQQCRCQLTLLCCAARLGRSKRLQTPVLSKRQDETPC